MKKTSIIIDKEDLNLVQALAMMKRTPEHFKYLPDRFKNKAHVLTLLKANGYVLEHLSDDMRSDKDIVREAVHSAPDTFRYASDSLKAEREFVIEMLQFSGFILKHIDKSLKKDKELMLIAIQTDKMAFNSTHKKFRDMIRENHLDPVQHLKNEILNEKLQKELNNSGNTGMKKRKI